MAARYAVVLAAMVSLGTTGAATGATPEACDPLDYVQPAPIALDVETVTATHILEARLRRAVAGPAEAEKDAPPAKGDKTTPAPRPEPVASAFGYPLTAAEAEAAIGSIRRILRANHSEHQKKTLILSAIQPDRFEDYRKCRAEKGFRHTVELPERIAARGEYFIRLYWHPPAPSEADAVLTVGSANASITEGHLGGETRAKPQEFRLKPGSILILKVVRTRETEDSEVVGSIGPEPFRIEVPARASQRLAGELKDGNRVQVSGTETCDPPVAVSCVESATVDTPLLPGSFRWKPSVRDKLEFVRADDAKKATVESELQLCRGVAYTCQKTFGASWSIDRIGTALQLRAIP